MGLHIGDDLPIGETGEGFRQRARRWLEDTLPAGWLSGARREPELLSERFAFRRAWHRRLHQGGWIGLQWPVAYGGAGRSLSEQLIFNEEAARVEAPAVADWVGVELVAPSLIRWGSEWQKRQYLPRILNAEDAWCQGWSEPDAGSDLASVATTAVARDQDFVIDGHKRWTSWAQFASHCVVLARTGELALRHRSLSCFIVPMSSRGLSVRPIPMANGQAEENDVSFDEVVVPRENLLGPLDGGWRVVLTAMECARGAATMMRTMELKAMLNRLLRAAAGRRALEDARQRQQLVHLQIGIEALDRLAAGKLAALQAGMETAAVASVEKLIWSRLSQQLTRLALQVEGGRALVEHAAAGENASEPWCDRFFRAKGNAIEGGTDEIQRNTIARRVLEMMD